ncbi:MAG TPA: IS5 family transposase [Acidobacteriaceae bacterium]|nr:IS5 family transposase [Acidobacteriaceae bacterium]
MRSEDEQQGEVFSYVGLEERVPKDHPLRAIRQMIDAALKSLDGEFSRLYARCGRPSIPPERLLRAQLLQVLYSIRSERQLMEQMDYNLLFRWFVGLNMDDRVWDVTVFTKNRERLMAGGISQQLLVAVVGQARANRLLSEEHFTVDGTLLQAWASRRSFVPKKDPPSRGTGARGRKLLRDTHESKTDPQARLYRKSGSDAVVPVYLAHVLTENRHGLIVGAMVTQAGNAAEREAALHLLDRYRPGRGSTLGADKSYQREEFIAGLRERGIRPHVAEHEPSRNWPNWLREQERCDPGLAVSQQRRKLVEKVFGWAKQDRIRQVKLRGRARVDWLFQLVAAAHNLLRMQKLIPLQA